MNQSSNIIIKARGKEYTMTKEHYIRANFAPKLDKKPGYVHVTLWVVNSGKPENLCELSQKEWKRVLGLGLFRFVPDKKTKHIRRFYIKD